MNDSKAGVEARDKDLRPSGVRRRGAGTLDKGLAVLEALAERGGMQGRTLTEVSELVGINKSTTYRILRTLQAWGYVRRVNERYKLGLRTLALGKAVLETLDLRHEARPVLQELTGEVKQTCHLGVLDEGEVVYIDKVEPSTPYRMRSRIGERMPMYSTALGKVMMAFSPEHIVAPILAEPLRPRTPNTVTSLGELRRQLDEIRHQGYAIDNQENEEGVVCVAAPVFDHRGKLAAAISVSGPKFTMVSERLSEIGARVCQAALSISMRMGYQPHVEAARQWSSGGYIWQPTILDTDSSDTGHVVTDSGVERIVDAN